MSFRVQFTVSDEEKASLDHDAAVQNYPNIAELCKARALKERTTMHKLYDELIKRIQELPEGEKFRLRDIIAMPPALLGRWLRDGVENGSIENVVPIDGDAADADLYKKIKNENK